MGRIAILLSWVCMLAATPLCKAGAISAEDEAALRQRLALLADGKD